MPFTIDQLKEQFDGNPAQDILKLRVNEVDNFISKYPNFMKSIVTNFAEKFDDPDLCKAITYGNISSVLKLITLMENKFTCSNEYNKYQKELSKIQTNISAVEQMKTNITSKIEEMKNDWSNDGKDINDFNLETFSWSTSSLGGLSDKETKKKNNAVKSIKNMKNVVIKKKLDEISNLKSALQKLEDKYKDSGEFKELNKLLKLLENKDWQNLVEIQTNVMKILCTQESGDGGFEKSLTDENILPQWYPNRLAIIKNNLMDSDVKTEREVDEIINRLEIMQNVHYVSKFKKGKKSWIVPVEQDVIIYDPVTNIIYDCGEVKSNYFDIGNADMQIRRDKCIIMGKLIDDQQVRSKYPQYFDDETMQGSYIAKDKTSVNKPMFTKNDSMSMLNDNTGFIITKEPKKSRLNVPSDVEIQITNWIYCSKHSDLEYVQDNIDKLISELGIRDIEQVSRDREIITIR